MFRICYSEVSKPGRFRSLISRNLLALGAFSWIGLTLVNSVTFAQQRFEDSKVQLASNESNIKKTQLTEFQIRVDIYTDESKPPEASLQTFFADKKYIEFDDVNGICTVVDPTKGRVSLLNLKSKTLVHLEMASIESKLTRALELMNAQQLALFQPDGQIRQEKDGFFSIGNETIRYFCLPMDARNEVAVSYGDFTSWLCRVKAIHPPKMPPQMRLSLNDMLMAQSQLPAVVRRKITRGGKTEEIVARLILTESLSNSDKARIATVDAQLQQFSLVSESTFFK